MLMFQKYRPWIALSAAAVFVILGLVGVYDMGILGALKAVDYNVLLMIGGTMGIVTLFIESKMPARLAEILITKVPNINILLGVRIRFLLYFNLLKTNASKIATRKTVAEIPHHIYQYIVNPPLYSFTIL